MSNYRIKGIDRKTVKSCALQTQVMLGKIAPKKPRKERAKETKPRDQQEAILRHQVIKWLRSNGYLVKRIENGICGHLGRGVPDILFFTNSHFFFCELKSYKGRLSKEQKEFKEKCLRSQINYMEARSIDDIKRELHNYFNL